MVGWDSRVFERDLSAAVNAVDRPRVVALCADLVRHLAASPDPYELPAARRVLKLLRNKRFFEEVVLVADWFLRRHPRAVWIQRDLAQALVDRSQVSTALAVLEKLLREDGLAADVQREAVGLLGRAHKQIYLDSTPAVPGVEASLHESVRFYLDIYKMDPAVHLWHGINVASLLFRARRDGVGGFDAFPEPAQLATDIIAVVEDRELAGTASAWDRATAAEALIGLGKYDEAGKALARYVNDKTVDAFELGGTYRQLTQLLQLDRGSDKGRFLADVVRAALLDRELGGFTASSSEVQERVRLAAQPEPGLERVFGADMYVAHGWLLTAFKRAAAVARIKARGRTLGTGFVVSGSALKKEWDHQVLLTNSHVVSQHPVGQLHPREVEVAFDGIEGAVGLRIDAVLFESPTQELDVTIARLSKPVGTLEPMPLARQLPELSDPLPRMYVIGHPKGAELSYSLQDNHLLGVSARRIHYRSPTDEGSSGSPVFDGQWDLVAIHRKGMKGIPRLDDPNTTYDANEGVPIQTIVGAINDLPS